MSFLGHAGRIARVDVLRMVRKHADWKAGFGGVFSLVVSVLLLAGVSAAAAYGAYHAGRSIDQGSGFLAELASGDGLAVVGGVLALFSLVVAVVFLVRAIGQRGTLDQAEGILTVVPTGEAYLGVLLAEYVYLLIWTMGPALGVGIGLALGTGVLWPVLTVPLAVAAIGAVSVGVGYPVGVGVRHFVTRFPFVARNKGGILVVVFVAYFAFITTGSLNEVMIALFEPMQDSPLAWYGHLGLLGAGPFPASALLAGGSLAVTLAVAVLSVIGGTWITNRHWFSDPALAGEPEPAAKTETPDRGVEQYLEPVVSSKTAALVALSWRRAGRSPLKLLYALYPMLILAGVFADIVQTGEVPAYLPYAMILFVAWGAGVMFTLNPLGDQGAGLSGTLLSEVDGYAFVHAHLLASLAVAVPLGIVTTAVVGVLAPIDLTTAALLVVASPVVMVVSSVLSVGIGMAFPKFEATNVTRAMKTVLPSMWAFGLFTAHLFLTAFAAAIVYEEIVAQLAAGLLSFVMPFGLSVTPDTLALIAAVTLVPLVLAPIAAYRYAVAKFDRYTIA